MLVPQRMQEPATWRLSFRVSAAAEQISGRCRTSAADRRRRACVCNVEARDVVAGDHDDVVLAGKAAVALITNARCADLVRRSQSRAVVLVAAQPGRRQRGVLADEW
jgi:hypothetical protein